MESRCFSFIFNSSLHTCSLGDYPVEWTRATEHKGVYSTTMLCNPGTNFTLQQNGSQSLCVRISSESVNYTNAKLACEVLGGTLYTPKTDEKLNIFQQLVTSLNVMLWIGLDDIETEDVFKWADDGSILTSSWRVRLFPSGQPDNAWGNEDCVSYNYYFPKQINDAACDIKMNYLCEMSILQL
ncbi:collectin-11-like [Physella acuta]|uniref:collectin-11-like n=1 Tax=Physella acuta TaxID=109671 RepID=UPI0027DD6774|nr:collectin-11-like [Physella acuta]